MTDERKDADVPDDQDGSAPSVRKAPAKKVAAKKAPAKKVAAKKIPAERLSAVADTDPITTTGSHVSADKAAKKDGKADVTPESLASDIERTRDDLAHTLDAIAEKVSPKRVASRTTKKVTNAVKETAHDAVDSVRDGASAVKEKVSGGAHDSSADATAPQPLLTSTSVPSADSTGGAGFPVPPKYLVAGGGAALLAWWLLRRRRNR